jgi:hypothetical protein
MAFLNCLDFLIPASIIMQRDRVILFSWGEKPVGYLIHSEQIAKNLKDYFNNVWDRV